MEGVSVIIPCYNAAEYLRESIESVLCQEYGGPLEILLSDDGSTDGSYEIGESFGNVVTLLRKPTDAKRGCASALNRGVRAATQPFVAILAADDVFLPGHLTAVAAVLMQRPELGLVYDNGYLASSDGSILRPILPTNHRPCVTADDLLPAQNFGACSVMLRRTVFDAVGFFDETLRHAEDYDMWLRILEKYPGAYLPFFGFKYRQHAGQKSLKPALWEDVAAIVANARRRYPYRRTSIRKRYAVLAYRLSQIALEQGDYFRALWLLIRACVLDPLRAVGEFAHRSTRAARARVCRREKL